MLHTVATEPTHNVSPVTDTTGLYYENEGTLKITNTNWDIMTYMNISNINDKLTTLRTYFNRITDLCNSVQSIITKTRCDDINNTITTLLEEIEIRKNHYYMIIGETPEIKSEPREKRAILNFVGDLHKKLYGTLSEEDGNRIDKDINELLSSRDRVFSNH